MRHEQSDGSQVEEQNLANPRLSENLESTKEGELSAMRAFVGETLGGNCHAVTSYRL